MAEGKPRATEDQAEDQAEEDISSGHHSEDPWHDELVDAWAKDSLRSNVTFENPTELYIPAEVSKVHANVRFANGQAGSSDTQEPILRAKDGGSAVELEPVGDKVAAFFAKLQSGAGRHQLEKLAGECFSDKEQLSKFLSNIEQFEQRARQQKLSREDIDAFYKQVRDVLQESKTGNRFFDGKFLQTLASDMMKEAADAGTVHQGPYDSCTAGALQTALFIAEPATIGGLIRDLALTGQYTTMDGSTVRLPERNMRPNPGQKEESGAIRNPVDQLAQVGLLNIYWQRQDKANDQTGLRGKITYEEDHPEDFVGDHGARLMDHSTNPPKPVSEKVSYIDPGFKRSPHAPSIATDAIRPALAPKITDMASVSDMYSQLRGNKGKLKVIDENGSPPVFRPQSKEDLRRFVEQVRAENHGVMPPIVVGVYTAVEPFRSDRREGLRKPGSAVRPDEPAGGDSRHGRHAVVLTDLDSTVNHLTVQNQWSDNLDHTGQPGCKPKIELGDLYNAIKPPQGDGKPPREKDPEQAANEYIQAYKQMAEKYARHPEADPHKVFEHTSQLYAYLSSWGRNEEATAQLAKMAQQMTSLLKSPDSRMNADQAIDQYASISADLKRSGNEKLLKEMSAAFEERIKKEIPKVSAHTEDDDRHPSAASSICRAAKLLKSMGQTEAAHRIGGELAKEVSTGLQSQKISVGAALQDYPTLAKELPASQLTGLRSAIDNRLNADIAKLTDQTGSRRDSMPILDSIRQALTMYTELHDNRSAQQMTGKLAEAATSLLKRDVDASSLNTVSRIADALAAAGDKTAAGALVSAAIAQLPEGLPQDKQPRREFISAILSLSRSAEALGDSKSAESANGRVEKIFKELQQSVAADDLMRTMLRLHLMEHYAQPGHALKLEPLIKEELAVKKQKVEDGDLIPANITRALETAAGRLARAGGNEGALTLYKEALDFARKNDTYDAARLARNIILFSQRIGKNDEAQRLAQEFHLEGLLRKGPGR